MNRLALIVLTALLGLLLAGLLPAQARAQDNAAVAVATKDGTTVFRVAFKIARVTGDVVDQSNAAVAVASCESCAAVAVAFQVVLVQSDPEVVEPQNVALAVNYQCDTCVAFASAYQWVLGTGDRVRFTADGHRRLAAVKKRLQELRKGDLTLEQLVAALEEIQAEVADILETELVPVGRGDEAEDGGESAETEEGAGEGEEEDEDSSEDDGAAGETTTEETETTTEPVTTTTEG